MEARGGFSSIAVASPLILLLSLLSVSLAEEAGYGEFTAELRGRELVVGSSCKGSCSGVADTTPCEVVENALNGEHGYCSFADLPRNGISVG